MVLSLLLVHIGTLLLLAGEVNVAHTHGLDLREIVLVLPRDNIDKLVVGVADRNDELASDLQLLEQVFGNLLCSRSDMDRIVWCLGSIASSAVSADYLYASGLERLRVRLGQVVEGGLSKFLDVLDADDECFGLSRLCAFVKGGTENSCAGPDIEDFGTGSKHV